MVAETSQGIPVLRHLGWSYLPRIKRAITASWLRRGEHLFHQWLERGWKPDLLHAHNLLPAGLLAQRLGAQHGIPYLVTEHSSHYGRGLVAPWEMRAAAAAWRDAAGRIAVSRSLAQLVNDRLGTHDCLCQVIPNLLDPGLTSIQLPERGKATSAGLRLLAVGLLIDLKGHADLLEAMARATANNLTLKLIGAGPNLARLQEQRDRLGLRDRVEFLGQLPRAEVVRQMLSADALVLPSWTETFGVVAIEALACGLPVVATACGGPDDIVGPEDGFLVPPRDPAALATTLDRLARERARFDAAAIRQRCLARYGARTVAAQLLQSYRACLPPPARAA